MSEFEPMDLVLTDPPYANQTEYGEFFVDDEKYLCLLINNVITPLIKSSKRVLITSGILTMWLYPKPNWVMGWFHGGGAAQNCWGFSNWQPILAYGKDAYRENCLGARPDAYFGNESHIKWGHPCTKPERFWKWLLLRGSALQSDIILDPFMGSGTTLVVDKQLNRKAIGIEIEEKYCEIAAQRIDAIHFANTHSEYEKEGFFF